MSAPNNERSAREEEAAQVIVWFDERGIYSIVTVGNEPMGPYARPPHFGMWLTDGTSYAKPAPRLLERLGKFSGDEAGEASEK